MTSASASVRSWYSTQHWGDPARDRGDYGRTEMAWYQAWRQLRQVLPKFPPYFGKSSAWFAVLMAFMWIDLPE
ncbi:hypothetical protein OMD46_24900 [Pseudomonas sp. MDMC_285]|nr:hypothetical protein [Pseudomonas sp. MDMC_285]